MTDPGRGEGRSEYRQELLPEIDNEREAAALCQKSSSQRPVFELVRIVPELALLGETDGALAALQGAVPLAEIAPATGAAFASSLGPAAAIRMARAQSDKDLELFLLLGVLEQMGQGGN